jgi:type IV pilus assembly protein PilM
MAASNAVWGIDIGQCALKAIKLRPVEDDQVEVAAFDVIEHAKILSQPDADRDELISSALRSSRRGTTGRATEFVIGVPGQQTFARFCPMPPMDLKKDAKKIPELVRYEASQQIPFDMDDVVWDYQVFAEEDSPDIEVGIFAIRKDLIRKHLAFFQEVGIAPTAVQAIPAALYNYAYFDGLDAARRAGDVIIDVGAQNTDLIDRRAELGVDPQHPAGREQLHRGAGAGVQAVVREGGEPEAVGGDEQVRPADLPGDAAGVRGPGGGDPAVARVLQLDAPGR